jgi:hypothetical protein
LLYDEREYGWLLFQGRVEVRLLVIVRLRKEGSTHDWSSLYPRRAALSSNTSDLSSSANSCRYSSANVRHCASEMRCVDLLSSSTADQDPRRVADPRGTKCGVDAETVAAGRCDEDEG